MLGYLLDRDPDVRVGMYSSWYDAILAKLYLDIPSAQFADALQQQSDRLHARHPTRFRRFIVDGTQHAVLLGESAAVLGTDWTGMEVPPEALIHRSRHRSRRCSSARCRQPSSTASPPPRGSRR